MNINLFSTCVQDLIVCGRYGNRQRFSDPSIGAAVNALARDGAVSSCHANDFITGYNDNATLLLYRPPQDGFSPWYLGILCCRRITEFLHVTYVVHAQQQLWQASSSIVVPFTPSFVLLSFKTWHSPCAILRMVVSSSTQTVLS